MSLEGTGKGDDRALSVNALDFIVRRQGPRVLNEIVKERMWPGKDVARIVEQVKRLPPFRKGTDEMLRLAQDLSGLAMALLGIDDGIRFPPGQSAEKLGAVGFLDEMVKLARKGAPRNP